MSAAGTSKLLTLDEDWNRAVAVAAHPDDLEYGAASAIARWTDQGKEITYLLLTRGEAGIDGMHPRDAGPLREAEEVAGAAKIGVSTVDFLDYTDGVIEYGMDLRRDITRAFRKYKPEIVISGNYRLQFPNGKLNMADHRWAGLAVLDAARDSGNRWIFPELLGEGFEPWDGVRSVLTVGSGEPTHGVDVGDTLARGIASLKEHRAYIDGLSFDFDPEEFLTWSAAAVGERLGVDYGVMFEVIGI
ncbi:MAG TPA: PIG-L deacetylase family protein [Dehalococcoidia bacterium]|jgi:LmbE family N-acetylglucosaminyl deacetylase|nr:PIG-L deacetylase family protein [Dehalococcoidia bacterium]MDP6272390.1 PIG-L deacetylase family protein [Dehalococcoidia bacterium]MDP7159748.1 PIG-L deacetylase family protein [Dehalococcoidia bacterium]MDP7212792.1 PIG-L deacetylase family protein [Dehalococcoidia bacterium]MDP7513387.1 PIG-L deacetylase family protein [Dehalococcoidia bacterium]